MDCCVNCTVDCPVEGKSDIKTCVYDLVSKLTSTFIVSSWFIISVLSFDCLFSYLDSKFGFLS